MSICKYYITKPWFQQTIQPIREWYVNLNISKTTTCIFCAYVHCPRHKISLTLNHRILLFIELMSLLARKRSYMINYPAFLLIIQNM